MTPEEARTELYEKAWEAAGWAGERIESAVDSVLADVPLLMQAIGTVTVRLGIKLGSNEWEVLVDLGGGIALTTQREMLTVEFKEVQL